MVSPIRMAIFRGNDGNLMLSFEAYRVGLPDPYVLLSVFLGLSTKTIWKAPNVVVEEHAFLASQTHGFFCGHYFSLSCSCIHRSSRQSSYFSVLLASFTFSVHKNRKTFFGCPVDACTFGHLPCGDSPKFRHDRLSWFLLSSNHGISWYIVIQWYFK